MAAARVRLHHLQRRGARPRPGPDAQRPVRAEHCVPLAARFGLNDQDILNAYTGADRVELDAPLELDPVAGIDPHPRARPLRRRREALARAGDPEGHRWRKYADAFRARATPMPPP